MQHKDRIQKEFATQSETLASSPFFTQDQSIAKIVAAAGINESSVVLDACCGPGLVTAGAAKSASKVIALDLTEKMLDLARAHCCDEGLTNVEFACGDIENIPFDDDTFDASMCRFAIHHLEDPIKGIAEMMRVTRPGGKIVIADLVTCENKANAALHNALETLRDPSHTRALPVSELEALAEKLDVEIDSIDGWKSQRGFGEWIKITNTPGRAELVQSVMEAFSLAGRSAGIDLKFAGPDSTFVHTICMLTLKVR